MMKILSFYFTMLWCVQVVYAQKVNTANSYIWSNLQGGEDWSSFSASYTYDGWKKGLEKSDNTLVFESTMLGVFTGLLVGASIAAIEQEICQAIPALGRGKKDCPYKVGGLAIGGGLGLFIGLAAGQEAVKKRKRLKAKYRRKNNKTN
ncbi:MAG: hypothetical protein AAGJ18_13845 [Bacteroidota bacterium]